MIRHSVLVRPGRRSGMAMMGVRKYTGGALAGISDCIYIPTLIQKIYFSIKYKRKITHCATFFYDKIHQNELVEAILPLKMNVKFTYNKEYDVYKAKMFLENSQATALRLIS